MVSDTVIPQDQMSRWVNQRPKSSIRHDFGGVKSRIVRRGGHISAHEFEASFPIGLEVQADQRCIPSLTIHAKKKSDGPVLFTLVPFIPDGKEVSETDFTVDDLKDRPSGIARALVNGDIAIPIRKQKFGTLGATVVYAIRAEGPSGSQLG